VAGVVRLHGDDEAGVLTARGAAGHVDVVRGADRGERLVRGTARATGGRVVDAVAGVGERLLVVADDGRRVALDRVREEPDLLPVLRVGGRRDERRTARRRNVALRVFFHDPSTTE